MKYLLIAGLVLITAACTPYKVNSSRAHLFDVVECEKVVEVDNYFEAYLKKARSHSIYNEQTRKELEEASHLSEKNKGQCLIQRRPKYNHYDVANENGNIPNQAPFYGSNPIYIAKDAKFSIEVNDIKPPSMTYKKWFDRLLSDGKRLRDFSNFKYGPHTNRLTERNVRDKELWLITTIRSQNSADPLEANSKVYVKSTQVKWDMGSHLLMPLDKDERIIFTHESDTSYRVRFQLMEVDAISVKKELAILRNQSGLLNFLEVGFSTLTDLINSAIGKEYISSKVDPILKNDTAFQRFLLSLGATVEFTGEFAVLRKDYEFINLYHDELFNKAEYYLIDGFRNKNQVSRYEPEWFFSVNDGSNVNYKWVDAVEPNLKHCINADDGGLFFDIEERGHECENILPFPESKGMLIPLNHYQFNGESPGFISFEVKEIPVKVSQLESLDGSLVNQYYDYNRLGRYFSSKRSEIFAVSHICLEQSKSESTAFEIELCKSVNGAISSNKAHVCGLMDPSIQRVGCESVLKKTGLDHGGEDSLQSQLLRHDYATYNKIVKNYQDAGNQLMCLETMKLFNRKNPKIKDKELQFQRKANDVGLDCSMSELKIYFKLENAKLLNQKISLLRLAKNKLSNDMKVFRSSIMDRVSESIISKCKKDKTTIYKLSLTASDDNWSNVTCDVFNEIKDKHNDYEQMLALLRRPND